MKTCRECGEPVSSDAPTCPQCGVKAPVSRRRGLRIIGGILFGIVVLFGLGSILSDGSSGDSAPRPSCAIANLVASSGVRLIDGKMDAGVEVEFQVTNPGESGQVTLRVILSTSEGAFERVQEIYFEAGQPLSLSYFFHEPTVNATNIQARVAC